MKIKSSIAIIGMAAVLVASGCSMGKEKEVAADLCGCTKSLESKLTPEFVQIMIESSKSENPNKAIEEKISAMDADQMMVIIPNLEIMQEMENDKGEFITCLNSIEKKYENAYTINEEKSMKEVLVEMEKMDCAFGVAILKLGLDSK
jgi:NADH:ubiquinone oxidoreductase subunit D